MLNRSALLLIPDILLGHTRAGGKNCYSDTLLIAERRCPMPYLYVKCILLEVEMRHMVECII